MTTLQDITTTKQQADLASAGILTLYQLLTYFPFRAEIIYPLGLIVEENRLYICEGTIVRISQKSHISPLVIDIKIEERLISLYYFGKGAFVKKSLIEGDMYQFIIIKKHSFFNLVRFAQKKLPLSTDYFVLGRSEIKDIIQPIYQRTKQTNSTLLRQIHRKIPRSAYQLSMKGLLPFELIGEHIDLFDIHHPQSMEDWFAVKQKWNTMNIFLNTMLVRYIQEQNKSKQGVLSTLDVNLLRQLTQNLPYTLSHSQKIAIWEVLQDITITSD